ncbi:MAG: hypothetical protein II537_06795, partial [Bacteroidales bacterium]|nr:hypothetical protein [Bacteroidales bacterium]
MEEKFRELKELMLLGEIDGDELVRRWQDYSGIEDEKALAELKRRIAAETKVVRPPFWQRY